MNRPINNQTLLEETVAFRGTAGESKHARAAGFIPAFQDPSTGRVEIARLADGTPAVTHLISFLPDDWAVDRDGQGNISAILPGIVAGFVRDGLFYTRQEAAAAV